MAVVNVNNQSMNSEGVSIEEFTHLLPKIELHAHINGSVSQKTLGRLIADRAAKESQATVEEWRVKSHIIKGEHRSLEDCFAVFGLIHQLCDNTEAAYQITKDVIKEFADDNVKYLELRTTPREVPSTGMTKVTYIENVLRAIEESHELGLDIKVRLLLAIDRGRHTEEDAMAVVKLADDFRQKTGGIVVGVDLSGNPATNDARVYLPALREAQRRGLRLALHLAEIKGSNEETEALLGLPPDRLGHGTFLQPEHGGNEAIMKLMDKHKVPIEACLTSNVCLQTVRKYDDHHLGFWYGRRHPCIICTDDKGVFDTTLSQEFVHAHEALGLSRDELWQLSYAAIDCIFESDQVKQDLRGKWTAWKESMLRE